MANNPYVNKVVFGNMTLIDTSGVTVTPDKLAEGYTALDASGALITGNIPSKSSSNLTASGATVTAPAGYYSTAAAKTIDSGSTTQNAPTINSSTGLVTATATVTAGYQAADTKSNTLQLTTQAAQTITPGTTNQTIAAGKYLTGTQTIAGDSNLVAENIAEGVSIFGVTGTHSGGASGTITVDLGLIEGSFYYLALPYGVTANYYNQGMQGAGMFDDGYIFTTSYNTSFSVLISSSFAGFEVIRGGTSCNVTNSGIITIGSGTRAQRVKVFTITLTNEDIALTDRG
jgi:hypothetical protein